ncbi:A/G-specific adenine glycosylase [bacterium]|nr:A/G-specific adenine glycosylase [bacterium]
MRVIQQSLLAWYDTNSRDLPWRITSDPYKILVSEIMLQQTRVETVIPYYHRFLESLPNIKSLANIDDQTLLKLWEGLGYYRRALNLKRTAQQIVNQLNCSFPSSAEEWEKLPGIGRYTAGALGSIVNGEQTALVDGNVKRVYARMFNIELPVNEKNGEDAVWDIANNLVPAGRPGDYNQALMELGATVCLSRNPSCSICPVISHCKAFKLGIQDKLPARKKKKSVPQRTAASAIIQREEKFLLLQRPTNGMLGGLWELPTVIIPHLDLKYQEIEAIFDSQLNLKIKIIKLEASARHAYTHFKIHNLAFSSQLIAQDSRERLRHPYKWIDKDQISGFPVHVVQQKLFAQLFDSQQKLSLQ